MEHHLFPVFIFIFPFATTTGLDATKRTDRVLPSDPTRFLLLPPALRVEVLLPPPAPCEDARNPLPASAAPAPTPPAGRPAAVKGNESAFGAAPGAPVIE